jgi:hypothetical protein
VPAEVRQALTVRALADAADVLSIALRPVAAALEAWPLAA